MRVWCDGIENCTSPLAGTKATFQCVEYYENLDRARVILCRDGTWDYPVPRCEPVCGKKRVKTRTLRMVQEESDHPWQVAIYDEKKVLICAGILITQKLVLSAAHCVTNVSTNAVLPAENYKVAVGKYYRSYGDSRDRHAQYSSVSNIKIPEDYAGLITNYVGDIAILVAEREFVLNEQVLPICVDYGLNINSNSFSEEGLVTGWGYTHETKGFSEVLKEISVSASEFGKCRDFAPTGYLPYFTFDKTCAISRSQNKTLCKGDSGDPLVFKNKEDGRYYVQGLASTTPPSYPEICMFNFTLYTKVSKYINFITKGKVPPRKDQCLLPQHPEFGYWVITNGNNLNLQPGDSADNGTSLEIKCNHPENYTLIGQTLAICIDGVWNTSVGQCKLLCPSIYSTPAMTVWCDGIENCTRPINLTRATFQCANYYEDLNLTDSIRICNDGSWNNPIPKCDVACGQKTVKVQTLIIEGQDAIEGDYPWQVAIYNKNKILICGGSLITQKLVLSAAHCVTNSSSNVVFPAENYEVAVGKYYRSYRDSRDRQAQYSEISTIIISYRYKGITLKYVGDIAVLVAVRRFVLSEQVLPICVDYLRANINSSIWQQGVVTGWGYTTESAEPSEVLKELHVPHIDDNECRAALPNDFAKNYFNYDKICAGFHNQNKSVCKGDSGGPLAFKNKKDGKYYVQGIVSLSPRFSNRTTVGVCSSQHYAVYTKVSEYVSFIENVKAIYD